MAVRRVGEPATPRLAVFLHGLGETEYAWGSPSYGERLHEDLGDHAGLRPLQHRPAHLPERRVAGGAARRGGRVMAGRGGADRADRALDGRARRAQRLPSRRRLDRARPPHGLARHAALGRAARAGRPRDERGAGRRARDAPVLALPAPPQRRHPRPAPRLAGRRGLARPGPRRAALQGARRGPAARGRHPLLRRRHHHPQPDAPGRPPARRHARALPQRLRAGASASRRTTASSSAARTTSHCSTTPRSTTACAPGSRRHFLSASATKGCTRRRQLVVPRRSGSCEWRRRQHGRTLEGACARCGSDRRGGGAERRGYGARAAAREPRRGRAVRAERHPALQLQRLSHQRRR